MRKLKVFSYVYLLAGVLLCLAKYDNHNLGEILQIIIVGPLLMGIWTIGLSALWLFTSIVAMVL